MEYQYKHRDVNWLSFNERVLQEAGNPSVPLLERLKFMAIFSSNLDEYFRVRISQLRQLKRVDKRLRRRLITRPNRTLKRILKEIDRQQEDFGKILSGIYESLEQEGVYFETAASVDADQQAELFEAFTSVWEKDCTVIRDLNAEKLENAKIYMVVQHGEDQFSLVFIPSDKHGRFYRFKGEEDRFIFLDDVVRLYLNKLLPGYPVLGAYTIKLSRDAELYLEDETEDTELVERIYRSLDKRSSGQPTRVLFDRRMPKSLRDTLRKSMNIGKIDMIPGGTYHNFSDFFGFVSKLERPDLKYPPMPPLPHPELSGKKDLFAMLRQKDRLIHFPYQEFEVLENFVRQAAEDPEVRSIKISLYRIASKSALTDALLHAVDQGKEVIVFVEAKARFDEENNIHWGRTLEEHGAKVMFSVPNIKVHAKILLVEREEQQGLMRYAYIGTGNFNAQTAKLYCDHGIFTADSRITDDLSQVFRVLQRELIIPKLKYLLASPYNTRSTFMELVDNEIRNAREGKKAQILAKMNSLEDRGMIDAMYKASENGVPVRLLVRGFSRLVHPTDPDFEPISITSVIDRYLEHGRLYYFENGGQPRLFMGSADWMTRNLNKRIEVLTPILDPELFNELTEILMIQLSDNVKARITDREDRNLYVSRGEGEPMIRSQYEIYNYLKSKLPAGVPANS